MRWEYKIIFVDANRWTKTGLPEEINEEFDRLGEKGWELVNTEALQGRSFLGQSHTTGIVSFFKRAVGSRPTNS